MEASSATTNKRRVLNPEKARAKARKKQDATDGKSTAITKGDTASERRAKRVALKLDLEKRIKEATSPEDTEQLNGELKGVNEGIQQDDAEMTEAGAEAAMYEQQAKAADQEDEYDWVDDPMNVDDPDKPRQSIEGNDTTQSASDLAEALQKGLRLGDTPEVIDITAGVTLRDSQAIICCKGGFGKTAIVLESEVPKLPIYRIRNDVLIADSCPDLMTWRRAGKVKDPKTKKKWSVDDISKIQGIAIAVPPGYEGKPEDLVKLLPRLSGKQKDELKEQKKPIPKQPDVQFLIEWKVGIKVEGEDEERFTSFESRSGCRILWKKHDVADKLLLDWATEREVNYRKAGGKHSSEERSVSPVQIPPAAPTPPGGTPDPGLTPTPEPTPKTTPENTPPPEDKLVQDKPVDAASAYKTGLKEFESKFRMLEDIPADAKLTAVQKGEMIEAFDAYWAKRQAK